MSRRCYNGVILPEIPVFIINEYPYIWIRKDSINGNRWDLACSKTPYYKWSNGKLITTGAEVWYTISLSTTITDSTTWNYHQSYSSGDEWNIDTGRIFIWTNSIIYQDSVTSSEYYMPRCQVYPYSSSKLEYNKVLLPVIPNEHFSTNPFVWIRKNEISGYYELLMSEKPWYYSNNNVQSLSTTANYVYRIPINNSDSFESWELVEQSAESYEIDTSKTILWSLQDISSGAYSTTAYFSSAMAIDPSTKNTYLKWTITKLRNSTSIFQASEFNIYNRDKQKIAWENSSVYVSSNASYSSSEGPEKLIDNNASTKLCVTNFSTFSNTGMDIFFEISKDINVFYYSYTTANDSDERDPVSWKLYRSENGTDWTLLSTVDNANITTERKLETQLWETEQPSIPYKYLIKDSNTLYTIENNELKVLEETELTANTFINYGSDFPPTYDILKVFTNPKVYCWTDSDTPSGLRATIKGIPTPQTVITNNIDMSDKSITGIEKITAEYTGNPLIACSFDNKKTWKMYNGAEWVLLSETDTGMTMETLLAITSESWKTILTGLNSFVLRFTLTNVEDTVTNIIIDFTN